MSSASNSPDTKTTPQQKTSSFFARLPDGLNTTIAEYLNPKSLAKLGLTKK